MTPQQEAVIWRQIGAAFEEGSHTLTTTPLTRSGLCFAAQVSGLPAYFEPGRRINAGDAHGVSLLRVSAWLTSDMESMCREAAEHRAMSAYLIAEMVLTGDAPEGV